MEDAPKQLQIGTLNFHVMFK